MTTTMATQLQQAVEREIARLVDVLTSDMYQLDTALDDLVVDDDPEEPAVVDVDGVHAVVCRMIGDAVREAWVEATERAREDAVCWSDDDHIDLTADEFDCTPEQVAVMQEALEAWPEFVRDLRAGLTVDQALGRLPVAEFWRVT